MGLRLSYCSQNGDDYMGAYVIIGIHYLNTGIEALKLFDDEALHVLAKCYIQVVCCLQSATDLSVSASTQFVQT